MYVIFTQITYNHFGLGTECNFRLTFFRLCFYPLQLEAFIWLRGLNRAGFFVPKFFSFFLDDGLSLFLRNCERQKRQQLGWSGLLVGLSVRTRVRTVRDRIDIFFSREQRILLYIFVTRGEKAAFYKSGLFYRFSPVNSDFLFVQPRFFFFLSKKIKGNLIRFQFDYRSWHWEGTSGLARHLFF